uniref:Uncharacterized protein n=1 Tax=Quercus lobata TaxID=97700 RepID=A0A7N2MVX8_QUELO
MEKALSIVYQPQAVFRIRPVNCCSVTISGYVLTAMDILERTGFIPPSLELTGFARCGRKILSAFCLQDEDLFGL